MQTDQIEISYQLQFQTAFHFGTGLRAGLTHRAIARRADGMVYVPGSTLKGVLRDHATQLARLLGLAVQEPHNPHHNLRDFAARSDVVALIFGSRFVPGTLFFDDAVMSQNDRRLFNDRFSPQQAETRTQVSLGRITGTARKNLLFSSEYGVAELCFDGSVYGRLSGIPIDEGHGQANKTYSLTLLLAAFHTLEWIGGNKSNGAGRVSCTNIKLTVAGEEQEIAPYLDPDLLKMFEVYDIAE